MSRRINAVLLTLVIALAAFSLSGKQSIQTATAAPAASYDLLSSLPASDFIVYVDTQRIMTDVIPSIFVENSEVRARLESDLEEFKKLVGFDPRSLDAIAVGINLNSSAKADFDFALIARGRFDATSTIEAGLDAVGKESHGHLEKQTQQYEGRTIYSLGAAKRTQKENEATGDENNLLRGNDMVFVALDSNTVAFGNLKSVRATIDAALGRERVNNELVELATRTPSSVVSFSGNIPPEMASTFHVGNKQTAANLASIRQIYGSFGVTGNNAEGHVNLRMEAEENARQLSSTLNGLKFMAKLGLGNGASGEEKAIEALIEGVEIYAVGNELQITSNVPMTDVSLVIRKILIGSN